MILTSAFMYQFYFEKLRVWQDARELNKRIYQLTEQFPGKEQHNLINQLQRASVSITCNLAEGNSRKTKADRARFTYIAHGSLMEVLNLLVVANDLSFIKNEVLASLRNDIQKIALQLNALLKAQEK